MSFISASLYPNTHAGPPPLETLTLSTGLEKPVSLVPLAMVHASELEAIEAVEVEREGSERCEEDVALEW